MEETPEERRGFRLLIAAGGLIERGWCSGADARDRFGHEVEPWDERAASWSLLGAIVAVLEDEAKERGELPIEELAAALYALSAVIETDSLSDWNDEPHRDHGEVLDALSTAAEQYSPWREALSNSA
jgi:hypothetical protein